MRLKLRTRLSLRILCLISLALPACASRPLNLHGKLWQGDPQQSGITRKQDNKTIKCSDPSFADYSALLTKDLAEYGKACKERGK